MSTQRGKREKKKTHQVRPRLPRRIAHIDLDTFFVSVERVHDPSLIGKPVLVGVTNGRGVVASASYESRHFGCHSAQPMVQALRLCPQAIVIPPHFERYRETSNAFHAILRDCSPLVESAGLDEAYVDLTGIGEPAHHDGGRSVLATACERVRSELGIPVSACIASTRTTAKVGSDRAKPNGLITVEPGSDAAFLNLLPVRELPMVGPRMAEALAAGAVHTIGELAALDRRWLATRFGRVGEVLHDRAAGIDPAPVHIGRRTIRSVSREVTFSVDVIGHSELRRVLGRHAERVGSDLRVANRRARTVTLKLRWNDFRTVTRSRTLAQPTYSTRTLTSAGADLLDEVLAQKGRQRVRMIGLAANNLTGNELQLGFDDAVPKATVSKAQREEQLDRTLDAIRNRHGDTAITRGSRRGFS